MKAWPRRGRGAGVAVEAVDGKGVDAGEVADLGRDRAEGLKADGAVVERTGGGGRGGGGGGAGR